MAFLKTHLSRMRPARLGRASGRGKPSHTTTAFGSHPAPCHPLDGALPRHAIPGKKAHFRFATCASIWLTFTTKVTACPFLILNIDATTCNHKSTPSGSLHGLHGQRDPPSTTLVDLSAPKSWTSIVVRVHIPRAQLQSPQPQTAPPRSTKTAGPPHAPHLQGPPGARATGLRRPQRSGGRRQADDRAQHAGGRPGRRGPAQSLPLWGRAAAEGGGGGGSGGGAPRRCLSAPSWAPRGGLWVIVALVYSVCLLSPALSGWKGVLSRRDNVPPSHRLVLHYIDAHCFLIWDLPGDVLAAPDSAL